MNDAKIEWFLVCALIACALITLITRMSASPPHHLMF